MEVSEREEWFWSAGKVADKKTREKGPDTLRQKEPERKLSKEKRDKKYPEAKDPESRQQNAARRQEGKAHR